jgi:hypothetical protein
MADNQVKVIISAETEKAQEESKKLSSVFKESFDKVKESISESSEKMNEFAEKSQETSEKIKESFEKINESLEKLQTAFIALTAVTAGGSALKEMVDDFQKGVMSANNLAQQLGITANQAKTLQMSAEDVGVSQDTLSISIQHINQNLATNEKLYNQLGIATRDANGHLKNGLEIFNEISEKGGKLKAGIDQAAFAQRLLGRNGAELIPTFGRMNELMQENREKAEKLGLFYGNSAETAEKFREAQLDLKDIFEGLNNQIVEAVLPTLLNLTNWFKEDGPAAIKITIDILKALGSVFSAVFDVLKTLYNGIVQPVLEAIGSIFTAIFGSGGETYTALDYFKSILLVITTTFQYFAISVKDAVNNINFMLAELVNSIVTVAKVFNDLIHLRFSKIGDDIKEGVSNGMNFFHQRIQEVKGEWKQFTDQVGKTALSFYAPKKSDKTSLVNQGTSGTETLPEDFGVVKRGNSKVAHAKKVADQTAQIDQAEFNLKKQLIENEINLLKDKESQESKLNDEKFKKNKITIQEYYAEKKKLLEEDYTQELKLLNLELSEKQAEKPKNLQDAIRLKTEEVALQGKINLLTQKNSENLIALKQKEDSQIQSEAQKNSLALLDITKSRQEHELNLEKINDQQKLALKQIDGGDMLQLEKKREEQEYSINLEYLQKKLNLYQNDVKEKEKINNQIEQLENKHAEKMLQINNKIVLDQKSNYLDMFNTAQSGLSNFIEQFVKAPTKIKDAFKNLANSVANEMVKLAAQHYANQIMNGSGIKQMLGLVSGSDKSSNSGTTSILKKFIDVFTGSNSTNNKSSGIGILGNLVNLLDGTTQSIFSSIGSIFSGGGSSSSSSGGSNIFSSIASGLSSIFSSGGGSSAGGIGSAIGSIFSALPSFAIGTNYVPGNMVAQIHKGEAIVPARYNTTAYQQANSSSVVNNQFILSSPSDKRTQMQLGSIAGASIQQAMMRNS